MKFFKHFLALSLSAVIGSSSFGTTALAADTQDSLVSPASEETLYEFDITSDMVNSDGIIELSTASLDVNQTFTFRGSHRGADRRYSGSTLQYSVTVTDENGNAVNNTIAVRLYDYNHSYALKDTQVSADGSTITIPNVPIVSNRTYYFKYVRLTGTDRKLKVHMRIWSY